MDGDCSHEIKRRLLLGRIAMTNLANQKKKKERERERERDIQYKIKSK